ncbi:hypothetical protein DL766_000685 [Monosporascus sp. MC13-8B]|uniref:REM-1 domain-containing protein n=1 Tax=Monosporascus cannonballus TaxID=155416 RepID=A0ABY0HDG7_9PEZI|nr:hypothetical protein DL762_003876 [Monosporascus cannonballus]RYP38876.1 hypothetical protein DL766_000685 [Monosporascus sp. MC13-8B]
MLSSSAVPPQKSFNTQNSASSNPAVLAGRTSLDRDGSSLRPPISNSGVRNVSGSTVSFAPSGPSLNPSPGPGSFSSELRSQMMISRAGSRAEAYNLDKLDEDDGFEVEHTLAALNDSLNRELKIREGSENLLEALNAKKAKQTKEQRIRVEAELTASNSRIKELKQKIHDAQRTKATPTTPTRHLTDGALPGTAVRSPASASRSAMGSEFDEPTESPTFALAEILQALEVEGMTPEYYVGRANSLVDLFKRYPTLKYDLVWSIFGDRMQVMLLSGSREVVAAGYRMLRYAISDIASLKKIRSLNTDYSVVVSLAKDRKADVEREQALKFVRAFLDVKGGVREVSRALVRTIAAIAEQAEDRLRPICIETLAEILVRDPALIAATGGIAPMSDALTEGTYKVRDTILDLLYSLLRIKPPAWATKGPAVYEDDGAEQNFVEHYTALLLVIFIRAGMMPSLLQVAQEAEDPTLKRKSTLLIGETLKLASRILPPSWSSELQLLPELFSVAAQFKDNEKRFNATGIVYQISSVSRTLYRSSPSGYMAGHLPSSSAIERLGPVEEAPKPSNSVNTDDTTFRQLLIDSGVLGSSNPSKWNWDVVLRIIEGPLMNGKRLEEAVKASKFGKRIMSFYRPFKHRFSEIKSTRNTQKYVRVGCAFIHTLLQTSEGTSGLTAPDPMFSRDRLENTLCGGYFAMLGVLSSEPRGLQMLERWRIFNMVYHIVDLKQRPDLIKLLLSNFDYSIPGQPRVLLSKALTAGTKEIRIHATNVLRKFATLQRVSVTGQVIADSKWAIQMLVTQLYDPEVEVCATAVKILEKACNNKNMLEYIVECRPALDHLGEIGAPLLLRFLSTSIGYHYLDGLDYISNEMDDWFLGRNDTYVSLIEASLARSFVDTFDDQPSRISIYEDELDSDPDHQVPPHFYRELTRTKEGCKLLEEKGHFEEFATTIRDYGMQSDDIELMTKVKGCMWAVGNVGSMELGAPFLEATDVVGHIVKIAESHEVMSLRGTAFFVLGLISRSLHGFEMLAEHGWESNTTPLGTSLGLCIPSNLSNFFSFQPWKHVVPASIELPDTQKTIPEPPPAEIKEEDDTNRRILELMVALGDMVLYKKAKQELLQLRHRKVPGFRQPALFRQVLAYLEFHHYRLPDRHLVIELFDKSVLRHIVYGESSSDEDNSSGDEQRTERQRSVSNPTETDHRDAVALQRRRSKSAAGGGPKLKAHLDTARAATQR